MKTYTLSLVRSTKNKHVYADSNDVLGAVYIPKTEVASLPPEQITITLTEVTDPDQYQGD